MSLLKKIFADGGEPVKSEGMLAVPVMSDDLRNAISRLKGEALGPDLMSPQTRTHMFPVSADIIRETEALENPQPGQLIPGKGVFVGLWSPRDRGGISLGKIFNLFAAPYDLGLNEYGQGQKRVVPFKEAVMVVGEIHNFMDHDGGFYADDTMLYQALRDGRYKGEWFIPTQDLLTGVDLAGNKTQNDNLYAHKDTGAFKNTFTIISESNDTRWYCSCTDAEHLNHVSCVQHADFIDGGTGCFSKDRFSLSCRLVRAELRPDMT